MRDETILDRPSLASEPVLAVSDSLCSFLKPSSAREPAPSLKGLGSSDVYSEKSSELVSIPLVKDGPV